MSIGYYFEIDTDLSPFEVFQFAIESMKIEPIENPTGKAFLASGSGITLRVRACDPNNEGDKDFSTNIFVGFAVDSYIEKIPDSLLKAEEKILEAIAYLLAQIEGNAQMQYLFDTTILIRKNNKITLYTDFWTYSEPSHLSHFKLPYDNIFE